MNKINKAVFEFTETCDNRIFLNDVIINKIYFISFIGGLKFRIKKIE